MKSLFWLLALVIALPSVACDGDTTTEPPAAEGDDEIGTVIPAGKADDFFSQSAQEYYVETTVKVELDASWADRSEEERLAEVKRLAPFKQVWVGWFLKEYLVEKSHDAGNADYGSYKALTKNGSYEELAIRLDPEDDSGLVWLLDIRQEAGGQYDLLQDIEGATSVDGRIYEFELIVGNVSNADLEKLETNNEWYRKKPWSGFNPSELSDDQKSSLTVKIWPEERSDDAWIDTARLYADGKVSIGVHFGWDYHKAYHEVHSKSVYNWLTSNGFTSPVERWEDLSHDAGPLTGTITYGGEPVQVEISLFWGRSGDATDPDTDAGGKQLEADMLDSLATREVVVFSGHSGPFYGFALGNWRKTDEGDVDDTELAVAPLNVGAYQLILAEGCDTYALGQAFYDNPHKPGLEDLDVITTTSFSNASTANTVLDTLKALLGSDGRNAKPTKYSELMRDLDSNSYWFSTMYGVHGIDDNPTVHPLADLGKTCATCASHGECGEGMRCVGMADGAKVCAAVCTASRDCGEGFACRNVEAGGWIKHMACVPESLSCEVEVDDPISLMINEVLADPASGDAGDANGDGTRSYWQDEFVEIVNLSPVEVDLSGWTLSDAVRVRHTFPTGTVVAPGGAIVVFGGGEPALSAGTTVFQTATGVGGLGLNNSGDHVKLGDLDGNPVAEARWGSEGGKDLAMTRLSDGDPAAEWTTATPSPGTKLDGSNF